MSDLPVAGHLVYSRAFSLAVFPPEAGLVSGLGRIAACSPVPVPIVLGADREFLRGDRDVRDTAHGRARHGPPTGFRHVKITRRIGSGTL
jgi:hypothetical protein